MSACGRSATTASSRCPRPPPNNAPIMAAALGTLRDASKTARVLGAVRDLLHLRRQHQRPGPGASDPDVPRFRHSAGAGREPARRDGHLRFLRHHRLGLAVGPLRQPLSAVLVLRPARAVAGVPAVHRFLVLRPVAVCDVLRPRLDRDRAADGAADRAAVRAGARQSRVRLDLRRPPTRRRHRGIRRRPVADGACELSAGVLRRRRAVHHRLAVDAGDFAAARKRWRRQPRRSLLPRPALCGERVG